MSFPQMVVVGIIILICVPPEKLPAFMHGLGKFLGDFRRHTFRAWEELKREAAYHVPANEDLKNSTAGLKKDLQENLKKVDLNTDEVTRFKRIDSVEKP